MPQDSDRRVDRMLAGGKLSGAQMDDMWDSLEARMPKSSKRTASWWWALMVPVAAAAAALLLVPRATFQARGGSTTVHVDASCGQSDAHPCHVGERVYLRVTPGQTGLLWAGVIQGEQVGWLVEGLSVRADVATALPRAAVVESDDVPAVVVMVRVFETPPRKAALKTWTDARQDTTRLEVVR